MRNVTFAVLLNVPGAEPCTTMLLVGCGGAALCNDATSKVGAACRAISGKAVAVISSSRSPRRVIQPPTRILTPLVGRDRHSHADCPCSSSRGNCQQSRSIQPVELRRQTRIDALC